MSHTPYPISLWTSGFGEVQSVWVFLTVIVSNLHTFYLTVIEVYKLEKIKALLGAVLLIGTGK